MSTIIIEWPQYFTATNLEWKKLLQPDKYNLIWQMRAGIDPDAVQRDFLKYTAGKIKADLRRYHPKVLEHFRVDADDRKYQFWERNALRVELRTHDVFLQKLGYIHWNPGRARLCPLPEQYKYSSARFYETGIDNWGFLTHYRD